MANPITLTVGNTSCTYQTFEEALDCKAQIERDMKQPYFVDVYESRFDDNGYASSYEADEKRNFSIRPFPECTGGAVFDSFNSESNRIKAKACAESLERIYHSIYYNYSYSRIEDLIPDFWDAYEVYSYRTQ